MVTLEAALLERCVKRALDYSGAPYTLPRLAARCTQDISYTGHNATTSIRLAGTRGRGIKLQRRLFPTGPLGTVRGVASAGVLRIEFPSVELLTALMGETSANSALADYYTAAAGGAYPEHMTVELAMQFAHAHLPVELDPEVIQQAVQVQGPISPIGNARSLIFNLLEVAHAARRRRWKRVDMEKWRAAGLTWPLIRLQPAPPRGLKPVAVALHVSKRQANLLRLFDQADDEGKLYIEQSAALTAAAAKR